MIFFIILLSLTSIATADESVIYAAVIYRHGDRTPVDTYPTDPWGNQSLWPVKFGELTNVGKRQHYALGQWLRKRYSHLLSDEFDPSEIRIRSTDVDRTLMSAQANLAGMYPPLGKSVWDADLMWQPIPVHTMPEKEDEVLAMKKPCVAYDKEMERLVHSKDYKKRLSQYQTVMDYLTAYTGKKVKTYYDMDDIYSVLYIETLYNFTLPNWTHSVYPDKLREPAGYSFTTNTATPLLARIRGGPLLKEIMSEMIKAVSNDTKALKVSIYSGHDLTIGNVLNSLGLYDGNCPVYTATIIMELIYDNSTTNHFIRISYRNSTEIVEPHTLFIPYCGTRCPIERFTKLYDNLLTVDFDKECENTKQVSCLSNILFFIVISCLSGLYIVHRIIVMRRGVRNRYYSNVNTYVTPSKFFEQ